MDVVSQMYKVCDDFKLTNFHPGGKHVINHTDIIVGFVDSGIRPNMSTFSDICLGHLSANRNWVGGSNVIDFSCNLKIVGAKVYSTDEEEGYNKIYDYTGHGSYMAAIACGEYDDDNRYFTNGCIPYSRIAMYKTHSTNGYCCKNAIYDVVEDGVDILCLAISITGESVGNHDMGLLRNYEDHISIPTLYATYRGIVCVVAAGNLRTKGSVAHYAPWQLTVGASKRNCDFATWIKLGDDYCRIKGYSTNQYSSGSCILINEGDACLEETGSSSSLTAYDPEKVRGKILICKGYRKVLKAKAAGAKGMIMIQKKSEKDQKINSRVRHYFFPTATITQEDAKILQKYIDHQNTNQRDATCEIQACIEEVDDDTKPPTLLTFSSRGTSYEPDSMKPNICAPGELFVPSIRESTEYGKAVTLVRGTSSATAFVSGVAGLIKAKHPEWTPDMMISAIMTSARPMMITKDDDVYGIGNGLIDPVGALDPGLVYDIPIVDYVMYARWSGCTDDAIHEQNPEMKILVESNPGTKHIRDLNLPSFSAVFSDDETQYTFCRKVRNVTKAYAEYVCMIEEVEGLRIIVNPMHLTFGGANSAHQFCLTVMVEDWSKSRDNAFSTFMEWHEEIETESETETESDAKPKHKHKHKHVVKSHILITKIDYAWASTLSP